MALKRYIVFVGEDYYPCGGWGDALAECGEACGHATSVAESKAAKSFSSVEAAEEAARSALEEIGSGYTWYHVVDLRTGKMVRKN